MLTPLQLMSDERLAQLAAGGDRLAFDVLFERHRRGLERSARSIVGNEHDAQDALQTTALKAFVAIGGRSPGAPPRSWLYRIVSNESITVLRRRRARPSEELGELLPDILGGPEERLLLREDLRHLLEDLRHISDRQRAALLMRQALGLDYDEIGRRLQTTALAARQCVFSARRALRRSADGREASCSAVRMTIASGDGRALRAAPIRAHLRICPDCRALRPVRRRVAALFPTVPSGLVEALRALAPSPAGDPLGAPLKTLAVAAALTVGTGGGVARDARRIAARQPVVHPHARRTHVAATTTRAKPAPVRAAAKPLAVAVAAVAVVRAAPKPAAPKPLAPRPRRVQPTPAVDDPAPQQAEQPAPPPAPDPQAQQATARCHDRDPAPSATSQPAPTPG